MRLCVFRKVFLHRGRVLKGNSVIGRAYVVTVIKDDIYGLIKAFPYISCNSVETVILYRLPRNSCSEKITVMLFCREKKRIPI